LYKYLIINLFNIFFLSSILSAQEDIIVDSEDYGDRLKIGYVWSGDLSFNPLQINSDYDREFANLVFGEGIYSKNDSGNAVLNKAFKSEFQDPTVLRIELPPNLTFHDGSSVTALDVQLTFELYKKFSTQSQLLYNASLINSFEVYGPNIPNIVRIRFQKSIPDFSETLGLLPILHPSITSAFVNYNSINDLPFVTPIGYGNFQFSEYKQNKAVILEAYKNHTLGKSYLNGIDLLFYESQELLLDAFLREEVDLIQINDNSEVQKIIQFSKKFIQLDDGTKNLYYINLNTRKSPFNNFRIRRAINNAINKDQITGNLFNQNGRGSIIDYKKDTFSELKYFTPSEYKPLDALQILYNDGFKKNSQEKLIKNNNELEFELLIQKGSLFEESIARIVAINLGDIGINVNPISIESDLLSKKIRNGQYQAVLKKFNFNPSYEKTTLRKFYLNELNNINGFQNFKNLSFDIIIDQFNNTKNENRILNIPEQFQNLLKRFSPCALLFFKDTHIYAINPRFENILSTRTKKNSDVVNQFKPKHVWFVKKDNQKH